MVASGKLAKAEFDAEASQSPSLRGSGRFPPTAFRRRSTIACLNPLHCGAVVASRRSWLVSATFWRVSIPFIAGQWSLRCRTVTSRSPTGGVSIPFIAGQWSLQEEIMVKIKLAAKSQSPSLRGSGRFGHRPRRPRDGRHVSIPFIAGQWSLPRRMAGVAGGKVRVSIPFIAGQWSLHGRFARVLPALKKSQSPSLRGSGRFILPARGKGGEPPSLNPLHCGAVVASRTPPPSRGKPSSGLNPLHCGAVVASRRRRE